MVRNLSKVVSAAFLVALLTQSTTAQAYYLTTTGTTAGGVYLVWHFMKKDDVADAKVKAKAEKEAEEFVRQNASQLNADLALASGPIINDMATAMNISPENKPQLRKVIRENRNELLELAQLQTLTPSRAGKFFRVLAAKVEADPVLAADLANAQKS